MNIGIKFAIGFLTLGYSSIDKDTKEKEYYKDGFIDGFCYSDTQQSDPLSSERRDCRENMEEALKQTGFYD